jgi:cytochrome b
MDSSLTIEHETATIPVWDRFVRVAHWTLVLGFAVAFLTEHGNLTHRIAGYAVAAVVAMRIWWGYHGPERARFANFVPTRQQLMVHIDNVVHGRDTRFIGHNPAAGAMIAVLLALMALLSLTGWMLTTNGFHQLHWLKELHEGAANVALGLICLHVAGAIFESLRFHENLPWSMVTGRKRA